MTVADDRIVVIAAFGLEFPTFAEAALPVYQALHGICIIESGFGRHWRGDGRGSNNMGAVQGGRPPCNPASSFQYTDTHPNDDGSSTPYTICFKKYETALDGVADVARIMYRQTEVAGVKRRMALEAAIAGDLYGVSAALRMQGYYEGFGRTQRDRIANHHKALERAVRGLCQQLSEPMPGTTVVPRPTLRRGSHGPLVKEWQMMLNYDLPTMDPLVCDGAFGKFTEDRTRVWQERVGLVADGVVGPKTWAKAEDDVPDTERGQ